MIGDRELERLREAFLVDSESEVEVDAERVWRAVAGELPPEERREVANLVALDPGYAEAWRLAVELQRSMREGEAQSDPGQVVPSRKGGLVHRAWLAAAAVLLAVAGLGVIVARLASPPGSGYRQPGTTAIESLVGTEALPRSRCLLQWTELAPGTRYEIRVTTAELETLADEAGLRTNQYLVPEDRFAGVAAGATLFWQVEARLPDGSVASSETFINQLE